MSSIDSLSHNDPPQRGQPQPGAVYDSVQPLLVGLDLEQKPNSAKL